MAFMFIILVLIVFSFAQVVGHISLKLFAFTCGFAARQACPDEWTAASPCLVRIQQIRANGDMHHQAGIKLIFQAVERERKTLPGVLIKDRLSSIRDSQEFNTHTTLYLVDSTHKVAQF
jgi:hypothetical protein